MQTIEQYQANRPTWEPKQISLRTSATVKEFIKKFKEDNAFANEGETLDWIIQAFDSMNTQAVAYDTLTARLKTAYEKQIQELENKLSEATTVKPTPTLKAQSTEKTGYEIVYVLNGVEKRKVIASMNELGKEFGDAFDFLDDIDTKTPSEQTSEIVVIRLVDHETLIRVVFDLHGSKMKAEWNVMDDGEKKQVFKGLRNSAYLKLKSETAAAIRKQLPEQEKHFDITHEDMIALMVNYCERDPSKEFPFPGAAQKIYDTWKAERK